jgi:putative ABC transport system permease protein
MLINYLIISTRVLLRNKSLSIINILGLTISFIAFIFILFFVRYEYSYDRFHENYDRIYRVAENFEIAGSNVNWTATQAPLRKVLLETYPEIEYASRLSYGFSHGDIVNFENRFYDKNKIHAADSSFFDIFSFNFIQGEKSKVFNEINSAVITEKMAMKLNGNINVINKIIKINEVNYRITGVIEDVPANSHFYFDVLLNLIGFSYANSFSWEENELTTYIQLKEGAEADKLELKLSKIVEKYILNNEENSDGKFEYYLQKLTDIHLKSNIQGEHEVNGNYKYVRILVFVAFFLLVIASINYVNLTTAKSSVRMKEIGIRKVIGAKRKNLVLYFLIESILISICSFTISMVIVESLMPFIVQLTNKNISINYFENLSFLLFVFFIPITIGVIAGLYPSFYLSAYKPINALKDKVNKQGKSYLRNTLVIMQFIISITLIIVTFHVYFQLKFMQKGELGFLKDEIMLIQNTDLLCNNIESFKKDLVNMVSVKSVSSSSRVPGSAMMKWSFKPDEQDNITLNLFVTDYNFVETYNIPVVEGEYFSKELSSNEQSIVLNEEAVKVLGWKNPIGKRLKLNEIVFKVIGVTKNFHMYSLHSSIEPQAFLYKTFPFGRFSKSKYLSVRFQPANYDQCIEDCEKLWKSYLPNTEFRTELLDLKFQQFYENEKQTTTILMLFSLIAIIIGNLGLLGLSIFILEKRTKEITIRKVLGASGQNLIFMLSKSYLFKMLIATVFAWPVAWIVVNRWLQNFAYRININLGIFLLSFIISVILTLFTVYIVTNNKVQLNPANGLRNE